MKTARITPPSYLVVTDPTTGEVLFRTKTAIGTIGEIRREAEKLHAQFPGKTVHALGTERGFGHERLAAGAVKQPVGKVQKAIMEYLGTKDDSTAELDELLRHCGRGVHYGDFDRAINNLKVKGLITRKTTPRDGTIITLTSAKTAARVARRYLNQD